MADSAFDHFYKLLLIGDQYTGKTSLLRRFTDDKFQTSYLHTIGIDFKIKTVELHGKRIRLQLWDTAGQERFRSITSTYYRGAQGIVLVYDIAERTTFVNIRNWFNDIRQYGAANVEKILVGNKYDMFESRQVMEEEGKQLASIIGARFIETSAKNNINVERLFLSLVSDITAKRYNTAIVNTSNCSCPGGNNISFNNSTSSSLNGGRDERFNSGQTWPRPRGLDVVRVDSKKNAFQVGTSDTLKPKMVMDGYYYPAHTQQRNNCCKYS